MRREERDAVIQYYCATIWIAVPKMMAGFISIW